MKNLNVIYLALCIILISGCSQSGRRHTTVSDEATTKQIDKSTEKNEEKTIIKMEKKDGVYQVPIEVNDVKMYFIFDTGAGMVSISETEANFLYKQGTLGEDDILGAANFIDANGNISEGTIINLKTVKIGNRTLTNIQASVVHNMRAPLLLGQTVLEEFGKISIDNHNAEITFE